MLKNLTCLIFLALLELCTPIRAESFCDTAPGFGGKLTCYTWITMGAIVTFTSEVSSALLPDTNVQIRLSNGNLLPATLTQKGMSGRKIKTADILDLNCTINEKAFNDEYGYASCELHFPNIKPDPMSKDYYKQTGKQPSWYLGANKQGNLNPSIIKLSQPIVWTQ